MYAGNELHLGLAKVGRDVRMRERRAQGLRVRRERYRAIGQRAQAFFFNTPAYTLQPLRRQGIKGLSETIHACGPSSSFPRGAKVPQAQYTCSDSRGFKLW